MVRASVYTPAMLADQWQCSERHVRNLVNRGELRAFRLGGKLVRIAGIGHVHPHLLRHSAAVHMAEDGVRMEEIAQYLGHSDANVTRKVYARFSPDYLRKAAASLEYDDLGALKLRKAR